MRFSSTIISLLLTTIAYYSMNSAEAFSSPQPARTSFHRTRSTSIGAATSTATTASVMQPQQQQQQHTTTTTTTTYDDDLCVSIGNWEHDHDGDYYDASSDTDTTTGFIPTKQALTLVRQVARRMAQGQREVEDDLVQEGVIALMQAINHYPLLLKEAKGGESFERYAKRYIILEMTKSLETGSIKLAPTRRIQIANELQIQPRELERYERLQKHTVSVESTVETDDPDEVIQVFTDQDYYDKTHYYEVTDDEEWMDDDDEQVQVWLHPSTTSLKELIVDRDELTPEMDALQAMIRSDVHDVLQEILNDVELQVIRMHFGLMGEGQQALSWKDTAKRMKTTKQFVQSISVGAIQKLRTPSYASRYIETYLDGEYQHIEDSI